MIYYAELNEKGAVIGIYSNLQLDKELIQIDSEDSRIIAFFDAGLIRQKKMVRDQLLSNVDWTQAADSPLSPEKKQEYAVYRQALRDMPKLPDFKTAPFPDLPS